MSSRAMLGFPNARLTDVPRRDDYGARIVRAASVASASAGPESTDALLAQLLDLREQVSLG